MHNHIKAAFAGAILIGTLGFGISGASAMPIDANPSTDSLVISVTCVFNGPHCVTGKYPDMAQELRNEAGYGIENPGCQGDCNQFGFIPDARRNGSSFNGARPGAVFGGHRGF